MFHSFSLLADMFSQSSSIDRQEDDSIYTLKQQKVLSLLSQTKLIVQGLLDVNNKQFTILYPKKKESNESGIKFQVLQLDFKSCYSLQSASTSSLVMDNLDEKGIQALMDRKLNESLHHLDRLVIRVTDKLSKVLVTGDLNAGKSTFINALLGTELLPVDQQPCTSAFCEVIESGTQSTPEVHAVSCTEAYRPYDPQTFTKMTIEEMQSLVAVEDCSYSVFKIYHPKAYKSATSMMDISVIDSPGLNHDSYQTMSLFAKQEDIDVIVFVINAANHMTLSASDFLQAAAKEKEHIFIVVNRFDDIKSQEKCKRIIMQQISQILPKTFEDSHDLVHFVSAKERMRLAGNTESKEALLSSYWTSFMHLESCLRSFMLDKRAKSKLLPARTYIQNLLTDILNISLHNQVQADAQMKKVDQELKFSAPLYDKLSSVRNVFIEEIEKSIEDSSQHILLHCQESLKDFEFTFDAQLACLTWPGLFYTWRYIDEVIATINRLARAQVLACERFALDATGSGIQSLYGLATARVPEIFGGSSDLMSTRPPQAILFQNEFVPLGLLEGFSVSKFHAMDFSAELINMGSWAGILSAVGAIGFAYSRLVGADFSHLTWYIEQSPILSRHAIWIPGALLLAGFSVTIFTDTQRIVTRKICHRVRQSMMDREWSLGHAKRIAQHGRKVLRIPSWELQQQFHQHFHEQERSRVEKQALRNRLLERFSFFKGYQKQLNSFILEVESLDL